MVICDVADEHDERAGRGRAATDPASDRSSGRRRPATRSRPARSSSSTSSRTRTRRPREAATATCSPRRPTSWTTTCSQTTKDEWIDPADPQRDARRGHPGRVLEGRVRKGPARDQHHVRRRAVDRRPPRALQARREGDRRAERRRDHVHGEVDDGRGRLVAATCTPACGTRTDGVADVGRRRPEPHVPDLRHCSAG